MSFKFLMAFAHIFQNEHLQRTSTSAFGFLFNEHIDFSEAAQVNEAHLKHGASFLAPEDEQHNTANSALPSKVSFSHHTAHGPADKAAA